MTSPDEELLSPTHVQLVEFKRLLRVPTATGSPLFFENREQTGVEPARNAAVIADLAGGLAHAEHAGTPRGVGKVQKRQSQPIKVGFEFWWPGAESNHRHKDFQSSQKTFSNS